MGSLGAAIDSNHRRPRFLCLHGFRTSGAIMRSQVVGKWPEEVIGRLDLVFPDAPFPAEGKSDVEGIFPPPYYEWFQFDKVLLHSPFPNSQFHSLNFRLINVFDLFKFVVHKK